MRRREDGLSPRAKALSEHSPVEFLTEFNTDFAKEIEGLDIAELTNMEGTYSLNVIKEAYDRQTAIDFLRIHIIGLNEYSAQRKMSDRQMNELADSILRTYGDYNQLEIMLFFQNVKSGVYGNFYDSIDPMRVMTMMARFEKDRNDALDRYDLNKAREERKAREEWDEKHKSTLDEFLEMHKDDENIQKFWSARRAYVEQVMKG